MAWACSTSTLNRCVFRGALDRPVQAHEAPEDAGGDFVCHVLVADARVAQTVLAGDDDHDVAELVSEKVVQDSRRTFLQPRVDPDRHRRLSHGIGALRDRAVPDDAHPPGRPGMRRGRHATHRRPLRVGRSTTGPMRAVAERGAVSDAGVDDLAGMNHRRRARPVYGEQTACRHAELAGDARPAVPAHNRVAPAGSGAGT